MKTFRLISFMIIASFVLSAWTPSTVSAMAEDDQVVFTTSLNGGLAGADVAIFTVDNRTGGTLFITLNPQPYQRKKPNPIPKMRYSLLATEQGKNQFKILAGTYVYTIRSSNCGGHRMNTKEFKGTVNIGSYYCDK
jgi:hypothetical protein